MRKTLLIAASAVVAAACGGGTNATDPTFTTTQTGGTGEQTPIVMPDTTVGQAAPNTSGSTPSTPTDLPDSDYPDVIVADLAGADVNLRTLALEEKPVLLWFWAPH